MKHTDYKNIIEAAQKLTKSKSQTREGAWRALFAWIKSRPAIGTGKPYYADMVEAKTLRERGSGLNFGNTYEPQYVGISMRDAWKLIHWRVRAERGAEKIMKSLKLKNRWEDLTSKRPRDKFNRDLAKTRRTLERNQYGALYMPQHDPFGKLGYGGENGFLRQWVESKNAEPVGLSDALQCVRDIEKNADEHGGWKQRSNWDDKGRGEQITVDLYGIDYAAKLYVIQVRQSFRQHKGYFLSVRKSYFLIGYNENGNSFAHPVSAGIIHGAIKRDPAPESPVKAAQTWIWGITEKKLPSVLRNGDVALIPAKFPPKDAMVFSGGEYRVDDDIAYDHHLISDEIRANGAIYVKDPVLYHRKGQHPSAKGEGWFKVVVGLRADFWSFARPTVD